MYLSRLFRSVNPAAINQASAVSFNRVASFSSSRYFNYADDSGVSSKMEEANVQHQQRASQRAGVGPGSGETLRPNEAAYASKGQNVEKGGNLSSNPNFRMGGSELGGPKYGESFSSTVGMDPQYDKSNSAFDNLPNHGNARTMSPEASQQFGSSDSGSKRSAQFSSSASVGSGGRGGVLEEHNRREGFRPRGAEAHGDQNMANPTPATNDMRSNVSQRQQIEDEKPLTGNYRANDSSSSFSGQNSQQQMGGDRHAWGDNEPARDYKFYDSSSSSSAPSSSRQQSSSSVDASSLAAKVVNVVAGAKDVAVDLAKDATELAKDAWHAVNRSAHENQTMLSDAPLVSKNYDRGTQARDAGQRHQQEGEGFIERAKEAWHTLKGDQPHASSQQNFNGNQQNFSGNQQGRYQNQQYQQQGEGVVERTKEAWETLKGDNSSNQQYRGQQDEGLIDRAKEAWETLKGNQPLDQSSSANFRSDRTAPNDYIKTTGERAKEGMQKIKEDAKEMLDKSKEAFRNEDVADRAKEAWATLKGEGSHRNEGVVERAKDAWETIKDGSKSEQYKSKDFSASSSSSSSSGMNSSQGYNKDSMMKGESEEDLTQRAKEAWKSIRGEDKDKASFSQKKDYSQDSKSSKDFGQQSSFQDKDKMENRSFEEKGSRGYLGSSGDQSNQAKGARITADKEKFDDLAYSIPELKKTTEAWKEEVQKALEAKEKKSKDKDSSFQESEARGYGGSLGEVAGQKDSKKASEASDKKIPERHSNKKDSKLEQDKSSSSSKRKAV